MYYYDFRMKGETIFSFEWEKFCILEENKKVILPNGNFIVKMIEADLTEKHIFYEVESLSEKELGV